MAAAEERKKIQIYSSSTRGEVSPYWKEKYEKDASKYWDIFYKRHKNKFFKDRHYLDKEWGHYFDAQEGHRLVVLEVGCGAGNTIFPLVSTYENIFVHACDFSQRAIGLVKAHKDFTEDRVNAFVCDLTSDDLTQNVLPFSVDIVTMVFVLSAVSPEKMHVVLQNIRKVLKPSGHVLLRDYADGDLAQERLTTKDQKISESFYVRGDGTRAFYFSADFLTSLFLQNGFYSEEICICCKQVENRSLELVMNRRWIQAVFSLNSSEIPESVKPHALLAPEGSNKMAKSDTCLADSTTCAEIDLSESMVELFGISPSIDEVIEIKVKVKDSIFTIKALGKEYQHTCQSTGLILWESAHLMSMLLAENPSILTGKTVLELGCGSAGIFSMVAARSAKFVVSTDGDREALDLLRMNVISNLEPNLVDKIVIKRLLWGNKEDVSDVKNLLNDGGFNIIIGTDVTYNPDGVIPLLETARALISDGDDGKTNPALVLCHIQRSVNEDSIISTASQFGFKLVDRLVHGTCSHDGIINSWFSAGFSRDSVLQYTPLNIMYFHA